MKFVITWSVVPGAYTATIKRFLETGAQPPAGVKLLGRYHAVAGSCSGFIVAESADAKGIYTWLADWMELCSFEVVPVVEDAEAAALQTQRKK
jgi:predicted short-subunit dehydrogenase-like oxidoreductase (DUF2520 family)